ncbi:MAG: hypothetical protein NTZ13_04895 [Candidatus Parcubacteria bacterium]|nr:hypothetical protein [Candidatus Parcubacteria bacterium]
MNKPQTLRATRYRVLRKTCRELESQLKNYVPVYADKKRDEAIIASIKQTLAILRWNAAVLELETQMETKSELF